LAERAVVPAPSDLVDTIVANLARVVHAPAMTLRLVVLCLVSEGHLIIEDFPGVGKTMLAKALARSLDVPFSRLQFTPDLLPSDVTGVTIFNQASTQFEFHPGPVFANIVIADEINRASPKTQAALLEVMEERHVTVDGFRHPVPRPFLVCATQNPIEMAGTYRLPEAQLDRFLMKLSLGYPDEEFEIEVMRGDSGRSPDLLPPSASTADVARLVGLATRVDVHNAVYAYVRRLAEATRLHPDIRLGLSPRACVALVRAARAAALAEGRAYVLAEDIKRLAPAVCAHRLLLRPDVALRERTDVDIMAEILGEVAAPQPAASAAR
jgi:MoxR-like ATPase